MSALTPQTAELSASSTRSERAPNTVWIVILLALAAIVLGIITHTAYHNLPLLSSDMLHFPGISRDLQSGKFDVRGWNASPAPYIIPELPLYLFVNLFSPDFARALLLSSLGMYLLLVGG